LRKLDYEAARPRPFEEVREDVIAELKLEQSKSKVADLAKSSIEGLTHAASWDIMLAENDWKGETLAPRRADVLPELGTLAEQAFAETIPAEGQPIYGEVLLNNGDTAIFALTKVIPGDPEEETAQEIRQSIEQRLASRDGSQLFQEFLRHIRANADVVINQDQL